MNTRIQRALVERRANLAKGDKGFTLIELLVVVIIIGILAAIAIPVYIGVQNSAADSAAKSNLTNAKNAVVAWYTDTKNANATAAPGIADLADYGYAAESGDTHALQDTSTITGQTDFCLVADGGGSNVFYIGPNTSPTTDSCLG